MSDTIEKYTIYAVKAVQPWEEESEHYIPIIYEELRNGKARFGWSYFNEADLRVIKRKINDKGWDSLSKEEKDAWTHAHFMLEYVRKGDYFVYINMPEYGKCTIVKITGEYDFSEIQYSDKKWNDFRHCMSCEFIATFDRSSNIVHPYLRRRLSLQRAWWRVYAKKEFEELLQLLKTGKQGKEADERFEEEMNKYLDKISEELYRVFPGKNLEDLLIDVFKNLPNVKDVQKGPDVNGADLEIEFESGVEIEGLQKTELCAVQVKSYEGEIGYTQEAIDDIRKAFTSNPDYTCGLIVSTALKMTADFEKELEKLRKETGKDVGILLGKDLARLIVKYGINKE